MNSLRNAMQTAIVKPQGFYWMTPAQIWITLTDRQKDHSVFLFQEKLSQSNGKVLLEVTFGDRKPDSNNRIESFFFGKRDKNSLMQIVVLQQPIKVTRTISQDDVTFTDTNFSCFAQLRHNTEAVNPVTNTTERYLSELWLTEEGYALLISALSESIDSPK